jgi:ABC-2 type transport system permease protein
MSSTAAVAEKPAAYRGGAAALAAEWIKLRSLRSMIATALLGAVAFLVLADGQARNNGANWTHLDAVRKARFEPLAINLNFVVLGVLLFGALGALVATNEYRGGLIRTTLAATPQRGLVLAAKAAMAGLALSALAAVLTVTAFLTGQAILAGAHAPHISLGDHHVLLHLLGTVYYLTATGLIGLFTGVLVRSAARGDHQHVRAAAAPAAARGQDHAGCGDTPYRSVSPHEPRR